VLEGWWVWRGRCAGRSGERSEPLIAGAKIFTHPHSSICTRTIFLSPAQYELDPHNFFNSPAQFDLHPHNSSYTPAQKMQATRTERRPKKRQSPPEFAPAQFLFLTRTL
jgi:hypothetical protein